MKNLEFPKELRDYLSKNLFDCEQIEKREVNAENVHYHLDLIASTVKKLKKFRNNFLKENDYSMNNLCMYSYAKDLDEQGRLLIKINEHVIPIMLAEGVVIDKDCDAYCYSINKINNTQMLYYASPDDRDYYRLVVKYVTLNEKYKYKVGNRVHLKIFNGTYRIINITHSHAVISCKKWQLEGKPSVHVKLEDIKCLAGNSFNQL